MKTNKSKPQKKTVKKAAKKQIELSLTEKFLAAVKSLGHDAEVIAEDIAKASKSAAKKLSKKFTEVKASVADKIDDVTSPKEIKTKKVKLGKKDTSKLMKKVDKSVTKVVKKAVAKAKPVANSVKVGGLATVEETKDVVSPVAKATASKPKARISKTGETASSGKKAVVKAVTNNPVKKVAAADIPSKENTSASPSVAKKK